VTTEGKAAEVTEGTATEITEETGTQMTEVTGSHRETKKRRTYAEFDGSGRMAARLARRIGSSARTCSIGRWFVRTIRFRRGASRRDAVEPILSRSFASDLLHLLY
jgi:hypothetical protein